MNLNDIMANPNELLVYTITNQSTGYYLTASDDNDFVIQRENPNNNFIRQRWAIIPFSPGNPSSSFRIINTINNRAMSVEEPSGQSGIRITLESINNTPQQLWYFNSFPLLGFNKYIYNSFTNGVVSPPEENIVEDGAVQIQVSSEDIPASFLFIVFNLNLIN